MKEKHSLKTIKNDNLIKFRQFSQKLKCSPWSIAAEFLQISLGLKKPLLEFYFRTRKTTAVGRNNPNLDFSSVFEPWLLQLFQKTI